MRLIECADRAEWLKERRNGIGGSDAPAIMRLSPWSNPVELFQEKLGLADAKEETGPMRWGNLLEPVIRAQFSEESGMSVTYPGPYVIAVNDRDDFVRASLDGTVTHPEHGQCVLQIKTAHAASKDGWEEEVPAVYYAQVQHEMLATGLNAAVIPVLFGGNDLQWYTVLRNQAFQEVMLHQEAEFWRCVTNQEPPSPVSDDEMASLARTMLKVEKGKTVQLAPSWFTRHQEYLAVKAEAKRLAEEAKKFRNELIVEAGDAEVVEFAGVQYKIGLVNKKPHMVKAQSYRVVRQVGEKDGDE